MNERIVTILKCLMLLPVLSYSAMAAEVNPKSSTPSMTHTVVAGDNLVGLATEYLDDAYAWRRIKKINAIKNPLHLKVGSQITIPDVALGVLTTRYVQGDVRASLKQNSSSKIVSIGDTFTEGSKLNVGSNSYLSLALADGSTVRVLSDSTMQVKKLREVTLANRHAKTINRVLQLDRGNVDVSVTKTPEAKSNSFEVVTPKAVAAVRGTRFNVSLTDAQTMSSGVTEGTVDVSKNQATTQPSEHVALNAGFGVVVSANGQLGVAHPLLIAPTITHIDNAAGKDNDAQFMWAVVPSAVSYQLRIANDEQMEQVFKNVVATEPQITIKDLALDANYMVGIRAVDADGLIGYEVTQQFKLAKKQAVEEVPIEPMNSFISKPK